MDLGTRLYLDDPELLEFDATIVETRPLPGGHVAVVLDRTAFYPTSGGQPHDTGTLEGEPVLEVLEAPDDAVLHRMRTAPRATRVHGRIDAERRRDHMQQHSGQHLLSATFLALCGRDTLSFHLGTERCSIDLPGSPLAAEALAAVERRANELVWEARPVRARFLAPQEAAALRKAAPADTKAVRVVEIDGWDLNACCGTHVRSTSAIGLIKLLGQEKLGEQTRVAFVCGARALAACGLAQERIDALVRLLTCHPDELSERCDKLLVDNKSLRKETERLTAELALSQAASLLGSAPRVGGIPIVVHEVTGGESALRALASAIVEGGGVALLGTRGSRAQVLFTRPETLDLDLRPALERACRAIEGRGGGPASRVQGAGPRIEGLEHGLADALLEVRRRLEGGGGF
jgi:alanyl-tRNA synthetase